MRCALWADSTWKSIEPADPPCDNRGGLAVAGVIVRGTRTAARRGCTQRRCRPPTYNGSGTDRLFSSPSSGHPTEITMNDVPVLISGAGPTGLVLALWLTRLGVRVRIIDQTAEAGTTSRALAVQARTLEFYEQAGFAQNVVDAGVKVAAVNMWTRGVRAARVPLTDIGKGLTPFAFALVYPQDAHERLLIEQLQSLGVEVERRTKLLRFEQTADGISASLQLPDGSEQSCQASYIAGCDGAHSTVREVLGIGFPGGTSTALFYVADVQASGPVTGYELHLDLDGADLLIVFPLKQRGSIRLVGDIHDELADGKRELTFDDVSKRAIEHMRLKIEKVNWFSTYRVHHRVANQFRSGRAFLLGDAAHIHSPVGGQG